MPPRACQRPCASCASNSRGASKKTFHACHGKVQTYHYLPPSHVAGFGNFRINRATQRAAPTIYLSTTEHGNRVNPKPPSYASRSTNTCVNLPPLTPWGGSATALLCGHFAFVAARLQATRNEQDLFFQFPCSLGKAGQHGHQESWASAFTNVALDAMVCDKSSRHQAF